MGIFTARMYVHVFIALVMSSLSVNSYAFCFNIDDIITANNDFGLVFLNRSETLNVLNNDYGLNSGVASVVIEQYPLHGDVIVNDDYTITYTPESNFEGEDKFNYKVCNNNGGCAVAEVVVDVVYFDYTPDAINDSVSLYWTPEKLVHVAANDTGLLNFPIRLDILFEPHLGQCKVSGDTAIVYIPNRGHEGRDSIKYSVCDAENDCSEAWLHIELLSSDDSDIFIPNGFSPNGDGFNDYFYVPQFDKVSLVQLRIFTSWGVVVYKNDQYKNDWDGKGNWGGYNGKDLDVGTYYYEFVVRDLNQTYKGYVYLNK